MPSFVCDACQDTLKKAKLDSHRCGAPFSCIDCGVMFRGTEYRAHTSCVSEAEKYQKTVYRGKRVLPTPAAPAAAPAPAPVVAEEAPAAAQPKAEKRKAEDADGKSGKKAKKLLAAAAAANDVAAGVGIAIKQIAATSASLADAAGPLVEALTAAGFEGVSKKDVRAALLQHVAISLGDDGAVVASWSA